MSVVVRRATAADAGTLRDIAGAAYAVYLPRLSRPPAPVTADYDRHVREDECWVVEHDGAIVGFVVLVAGGDHVLLDNIAVCPRLQGTGLGATLLDLAERRASELGAPEIRLYTNEVMTENQAYYARHGYVETHRETSDGYARVHFTKPVPGASTGCAPTP